jgi:hypothetical protein
MKLEKALFQRSYIYFILFFLLMLVGFWLTYFTKILDQENYRMHTHGAALIAWCLMLIVQPYLIRTKRTKIHRTVGKFSYLLVPVLLYTTTDLLRYRLQSTATLGNLDYYFVALVMNALLAFVIFYALAIYHRKKSTIHARYMICTAFPMFTPITDRIIHIHFPSILAYVPTIDNSPIAPVYGFLLADLLLIGLCIWDWRSHRRWNIFPFALVILLAYQYSVLTFYRYGFWQKFCEWFI